MGRLCHGRHRGSELEPRRRCAGLERVRDGQEWGRRQLQDRRQRGFLVPLGQRPTGVLPGVDGVGLRAHHIAHRQSHPQHRYDPEPRVHRAPAYGQRRGRRRGRNRHCRRVGRDPVPDVYRRLFDHAQGLDRRQRALQLRRSDRHAASAGVLGRSPHRLRLRDEQFCVAQHRVRGKHADRSREPQIRTSSARPRHRHAHRRQRRRDRRSVGGGRLAGRERLRAHGRQRALHPPRQRRRLVRLRLRQHKRLPVGDQHLGGPDNSDLCLRPGSHSRGRHGRLRLHPGRRRRRHGNESGCGSGGRRRLHAQRLAQRDRGDELARRASRMGVRQYERQRLRHAETDDARGRLLPAGPSDDQRLRRRQLRAHLPAVRRSGFRHGGRVRRRTGRWCCRACPREQRRPDRRRRSERWQLECPRPGR